MATSTLPRGFRRNPLALAMALLAGVGELLVLQAWRLRDRAARKLR